MATALGDDQRENIEVQLRLVEDADRGTYEYDTAFYWLLFHCLDAIEFDGKRGTLIPHVCAPPNDLHDTEIICVDVCLPGAFRVTVTPWFDTSEDWLQFKFATPEQACDVVVDRINAGLSEVRAALV